MLIGLLALSVGISIDAVALYLSILEFLEVKTMQNNNDFGLGGACGAKNHGIYQLVKLNTYDTSTKRFDSFPSHHKKVIHLIGDDFFH